MREALKPWRAILRWIPIVAVGTTVAVAWFFIRDDLRQLRGLLHAASATRTPPLALKALAAFLMADPKPPPHASLAEQLVRQHMTNGRFRMIRELLLVITPRAAD